MKSDQPSERTAAPRPTDADADANPRKRFNLELFLPLGGMIIVGITSLVLGILFYDPPERDNEPLDLPTFENLEDARKRTLEQTSGPAALPLDAGLPHQEMDSGVHR